MSRWINKDLFENYVQEKEQEAAPKQFVRRSDILFPTPEMGTTEKPKVYEGRFLQDPKGKFTLKYMYHGFKVGEKFKSFLCEKTHGLDNFCPFCTATQKLYMGNTNDKKAAGNYKRKNRNVGNWYVVDDPRDAEREADKKINGTVRIYEFPDKVESKLKAEITDKKNGLGPAIFDPGEDGFNFLLKAKATKKDDTGKVWPDYSDSTFSRKPYALGTDKEIKTIMESTHDLTEYIESLRVSDDELKSILKTEMLWELVEADWNKYKGVQTPEPAKQNVVQDTTVEDDVPPFDNTVDASDEELLRELESMK